MTLFCFICRMDLTNDPTCKRIFENDIRLNANDLNQYHCLQTILEDKKILYVVVQELPIIPKHGTKIKEFDALEKHEHDAKLVSSIILPQLTHDIQTNDLFDEDIIDHLRKIFRGHACLE